MSQLEIGGLLVLVGVGALVAVLVIRRLRPGIEHLDTGPASSVLSYVAAAFGILVGFLIVFELGEATRARHATGDEATAIGTAFDEAQLFPESEADIQHALICYSRAVTEREWPALAEGRSAPEVDDAYRRLIAVYGEAGEPTDGTFQPAAATNSFVQIGTISTARETRIVTATSSPRALMWILLLGAAVFVLLLLFVVSVPARPVGQALLLGLASVFTTILLLLVFTLSRPFREGSGPVRPAAIEDTTARMVTLATDGDRPCPFEDGSDR
jgi:hypothetical protein